MPQGVPETVPDDGLTTRQRRNRPLLIVHTGAMKGKSTAAFGLALRGWNQGWGIGVYQFVKSAKWRVGEEARSARSAGCTSRPARAARSPGTRWARAGRGSSAATPRTTPPTPARAGQQIKRDLAAERFGLYVLDEFTYPMKWGWIEVADVVDDADRAARPPARDDHRPRRAPRPDRGRRPGHRDDEGQAPDGRRAEGPARHRMVTIPRVVIAAPAAATARPRWPPACSARCGRAGWPSRRTRSARTTSTPATTRWPPGAPAATSTLAGRRGPDRAHVPARRRTPVPADIAVIEGVMGLFDGASRPGHAAGATSPPPRTSPAAGAPVVLVVDASGWARRPPRCCTASRRSTPRRAWAG